jgi:signal transduction histidine kinase
MRAMPPLTRAFASELFAVNQATPSIRLRDRVLRIVHVEDSDVDHEIVVAHLRHGGLQVRVTRVLDEAGFRDALSATPDVVLSDYNLPGFSGLQALDILLDTDPLVPFLLISGEIGEDMAVDAMRRGASDYLLKDNLKRLVPALEQALQAGESRRQRQHADAQLASSRNQLSALAQHLQTSVEAERAAIAREIHDDVGGSLTAVKFDLAWIARNSDSAAVVQRAQQAIETLTQAIEASQRVMHNLRPAILEQGLVAALQWMTQRFEQRTGIETVFRTSRERLQLRAGVPLVAYRMAQEALTNISKHARATRVQVDLTAAGGTLSLEVSDNGCGLSSADLAKSRSFGIRGLHERAQAVGGWVDVSSSPSGTTLILSMPLVLPGGAPQLDAEAPDDGMDQHDPSRWGKL